LIEKAVARPAYPGALPNRPVDCKFANEIVQSNQLTKLVARSIKAFVSAGFRYVNDVLEIFGLRLMRTNAPVPFALFMRSAANRFNPD
jgi:hypothetical protein